MDELNKLEEERTILEEACISIEYNLAEAKATHATTGVYANPGWFNRATYALKMKRLRIQELNVKVSALRRDERRRTVLSDAERKYTLLRQAIIERYGEDALAELMQSVKTRTCFPAETEEDKQ